VKGLTAPLHLADEGVVTVGGRIVETQHPGSSPITGDPGPGHLVVGHIYVHYRVPVDAGRPPIVMIHGSNGTGASFETTPDGREGWATWFTRRGHPVYVIDHAGRGRSGFDPTSINAARAGVPDVEPPNVFLGTAERLWVNTRIGPRFREPFHGTRFPLEAFDAFLASHVPNTESTLTGGGENTVAGVVDLLDRLGGAVVMVHSQGGLYGVEIARRRPDRVRALVSIEGGSQSVTSEDVEAGLDQVPFLSVWGDNSHGAAGVNGDDRRNGCVRAVELLRSGGGEAELMMLPDMGITGNSHAMMADTNNLEIAGMIGEWMDSSSRR
jgi:pimeloyl-ACP methyl ester carboxylesterase